MRSLTLLAVLAATVALTRIGAPAAPDLSAAPTSVSGPAASPTPGAGGTNVGSPTAAVGESTPVAAGARRRDDSSYVPRRLPRPGAVRTAWRYAQARGGTVSIAVVDSRGRLRARDGDRGYVCASTVKALLLAAELWRQKREGGDLDAGTRDLLAAMITRSDNDAADAIYARVGDAGLFGIARRAGMERFTVAGHWGNAVVTASDLARFFSRLDVVMPGRFQDYGKRLLASIIPSQRWGIPKAAGKGWGVRFKGGWLPSRALVHQAAELRERDGARRRLAIAVLSDSQPSFGYAVATIEGVTDRLLPDD
jgi:hypothetical protein